MSHLSKVFNKVPVKVQDRSGFDMSHENLFTATIGTLIPASVEEVMPGDVVSVGAAMSVQLPPLATDFKGRVDAKLEAFFVPNRLVWGGWQDFICQDPNHAPAVPGYTVASQIPRVNINQTQAKPGSLADYLGMKAGDATEVSGEINALPFLAYWKVWDDWYRDSLVQQPFFIDGMLNSSSSPAPYSSPYTRTSPVYGTSTTLNNGFNGKDLRSLAQRNFAKDYFTTMTAQPQAGAASELEFDIDVQGQSGSFSIASLRAANSLQRWLEKNSIGGTRYYDQILAHYGVLPPDANVQRAILLGAETCPVIVNSISQTAANEHGANDRNPYSQSTGAQFGKGTAFGEGRLIDNFEVKEHGYIIIMFSLVPHAYYSTGIRRYLTKKGATAADSGFTSDTFAFPEFANIGDQPVYKSELCASLYGGSNDTVCGYNQRYSEYKYHDDEVHGLLADGQSLESFVLQRGFDTGVTVSSSLLEIPTSYLDNVMVTDSTVSGFNCIVDAYFNAKYLRVLPEYSLPSL